MATAWALPEEVSKQIAALSSDLTTAVSDLRAEFDEKPESWQEGSKGLDISAWLEELDELAQKLDDIEETK